MDDLREILRERLAGRKPKTRVEWEARPAAVLVPLYREGDQWHVLYTRRTDHLPDHRGQVSFPGGRMEDLEEPEEAALREAAEEIGLPDQDVEILGRLDDLFTVTQFIISPVVARIPWPYPVRLNANEVDSIFGIPLDWLSNPANLEARRRRPLPYGPSTMVYHFRPFDGHVVWGATARITLSLLELLGAPANVKAERR